MNELSQLQDKLKTLLDRYYDLKEHAASMEKTIALQEEQIQRLSSSNHNLQEALRTISFSQHVKNLPENQKNRLKEQIDLVLQMIEKNINLLK